MNVRSPDAMKISNLKGFGKPFRLSFIGEIRLKTELRDPYLGIRVILIISFSSWIA